jgi:hypothetical protein
MSKKEDFNQYLKSISRFVKLVATLLIVLLISLPLYLLYPGLFQLSSTEELTKIETVNDTPLVAEVDEDLIENGIHVSSGLIAADGYKEVLTNCTGCHSTKIILQNRMDAEGWNTTIKWMQDTQNLWDLGDNQKIIVDYLVTNYPPEKKGRRQNLTNIEWYELED